MLVWQKGVCIMANLLTENGGFDVKKKCSVWNCTSEQLEYLQCKYFQHDFQLS